MSEPANLFDLFGPTSLQHWERLVGDGEVPSKLELADILEANSDKQLPAWFVEIVAKSLRGTLKKRPGRPKQSTLSQIRFEVAKYKYHRVLSWLQKRERSCGSKGLSILRGKVCWSGPPHERAAKMVTAKWLTHMDWRSFLNRVSS
jgi:hypothetical protein